MFLLSLTHRSLVSSLLRFILSLGTGKESEETNLLQQLSDACLVVDALEPSVREELVNNFCSRELTSYEQIFEGAGVCSCLMLFLADAFSMYEAFTLIVLNFEFHLVFSICRTS